MTEKQFEYTIPENENSVMLQRQIENLMRLGFQPVGGISVTVIESTYTTDLPYTHREATKCLYSQAMVREKKNET